MTAEALNRPEIPQSKYRASLRWFRENPGKNLALVVACAAVIATTYTYSGEIRTILNLSGSGGQTSIARPAIGFSTPDPNKSPTPTAMIALVGYAGTSNPEKVRREALAKIFGSSSPSTSPSPSPELIKASAVATLIPERSSNPEDIEVGKN